MSLAYKILAANASNGSITIQFENSRPFNISVPLVDGVFLSGERFEGWVQGLNGVNRWDGTTGTAGWEEIAARVGDGVPFTLPPAPSIPGLGNTGTVSTEGVTVV